MAEKKLTTLIKDISKTKTAPTTWHNVRKEIQYRMSETAAHIRSEEKLQNAVKDAWKLWKKLKKEASKAIGKKAIAEACRNTQLCFALCVYLEAILFSVKKGVGSRGSALVLDKNGIKAHPKLSEQWRFAQENENFKNKVLETWLEKTVIKNKWIDRRPLPESNEWFENAWATYREGKIYN